MKLIIEDDEGRRTVVPLVAGELSIGRNDQNTVLLTEKNVSRKHARLLREDGRYFIEDLRSFTGVRVNGERILGKRLVDEGDLIQISEYDLILQSAPGEERPPPLDDEDVIVTGPIRVDGHDADTETDASTSVIKMENVGGAPAIRPRDLTPAELARLVVVDGPLAGREFPLAWTPVAIGRTTENDVAIDDPSVSRFHCKLFLEGDTWKLLDNRSAHGVKLNGERYAATLVKPGDVIELGQVKLRLELVPSAAAALLAPAAASEAPAAPTAPKPGGAGRKLLGLGVVALFAVALALFMVQRSRNLPRTPDDDGAQVVTLQHDVIQAELGKARDSLQAHRFAEALQHFDAAQKAGATAEEVGGARIAQAELRDEAALRRLDGSIAAGRFDEAKAAIESQDGHATWNADQIRARSVAVRKGYVDDHLARAEAMKVSSVETCAAEAQLALAVDPASARAKALVETCSKPAAVARREPAMRTPELVTPRPQPARATAEPSPPVQEPAAPVAPASSAAPASSTAPASSADAASPADAETQARKLAAEGNQKLLAQDFDGALQLFQGALALKPSQPILASLYRSMGILLTRQGNIEEGAHYYRLYLPLCTNEKERDYLKATLEEYEARRR